MLFVLDALMCLASAVPKAFVRYECIRPENTRMISMVHKIFLFWLVARSHTFSSMYVVLVSVVVMS